MATITISIEDKQIQELRKKAEMHGLQLEELIIASIRDLISQPDNEFTEALKRVLKKNKELYKRLA